MTVLFGENVHERTSPSAAGHALNDSEVIQRNLML